MMKRLASDGLYSAGIRIALDSLLQKLIRSLLTTAFNGRRCLISACIAGKMPPMVEHFE
jgi:hypothetical protein